MNGLRQPSWAFPPQGAGKKFLNYSHLVVMSAGFAESLNKFQHSGITPDQKNQIEKVSIYYIILSISEAHIWIRFKIYNLCKAWKMH